MPRLRQLCTRYRSSNLSFPEIVVDWIFLMSSSLKFVIARRMHRIRFDVLPKRFRVHFFHQNINTPLRHFANSNCGSGVFLGPTHYRADPICYNFFYSWCPFIRNHWYYKKISNAGSLVKTNHWCRLLYMKEDIFLILTALVAIILRFLFRHRRDQELLMLRKEIQILKRQLKKPKFTTWDRLFFLTLYKANSKIIKNLISFKPSTVIAWHRKLVKRKWNYSNSSAGRPFVVTLFPILGWWHTI